MTTHREQAITALRKALEAHDWYVAGVVHSEWIESDEWAPVILEALATPDTAPRPGSSIVAEQIADLTAVGPTCVLCRWNEDVGHEAHARLIHPDADLAVVEQLGRKFIVRRPDTAPVVTEELAEERETLRSAILDAVGREATALRRRFNTQPGSPEDLTINGLVRVIRQAFAATRLVSPDMGTERLDRSLAPTFAKRLLAEVPMCTGCDFAHSWDDHVLGVYDAVLDDRRTLVLDAPAEPMKP